MDQQQACTFETLARAIRNLVEAGYDHQSVVDAVTKNDLTLLKPRVD